MVARTPPKLKKKMVAPLDPTQLRETLNKVEKCMARLQELQYITGGTKVISGVSLSPRSTRGYLRTSIRCKQESLRIRNANGRKSPPGKLPAISGEWKRMSLPAMLLGETMGEILQASQFAKEIVDAVGTIAKTKKTTVGGGGDPKTPVAASSRNSKPTPETTELRDRRKREKQTNLNTVRSESRSPLLQRAKSRINFKVSGSPAKSMKEIEIENEKCRYLANRVSPKNKPWVKKTVLFPNPLFHSSPSSQNKKFCRTKSPVIPRFRQTTPHKFLIKSPSPAAASAVKKRSSRTHSLSPARRTTTPHKFLIKSPPVAAAGKATSTAGGKFQVKIRSPTRPTSAIAGLTKKKSTSPPKKMPTTAEKLRRSFSPSRLASRLVSPLKSRKLCGQRMSMDGGTMMMNMMSGLKQRPASTTTSPIRLSSRRI